MAVIDLGRLTTDFIFSGDPIIATVIPQNFSNNSIFRQICVKVTADVPTEDDVPNREHLFTITAIDNSTSVAVDISSAIRSTLSSWHYESVDVYKGRDIYYPYASFQVSAWEREMNEHGYETVYNETITETFKAYLGGVGEFSRWVSNGAKPIIKDGKVQYPMEGMDFLFSSKPAGEIYAAGQIVCTSSYDAKTGQVRTVVSGTPFGQNIVDTRDRTSFLFVNSFGVFETVSVYHRHAMSYNIDSSVLNLGRKPSYKPSANVMTQKRGGGAQWQMSSGYVNRDWADWFASEFLMSEKHWMSIDGGWLPVAIIPDSDSVSVFDCNEPSLIAVNFTVRSALLGSVRG